MRELNRYKGIVKLANGKVEVYMGPTVDNTVKLCKQARGMQSYKVICRENGWVVARRVELLKADPDYNPHSLRHTYSPIN